MDIKLISELQYFPPIIWYKDSFYFSDIIFEQYEHYAKMSFRSRVLLAGSNGITRLTIPLESGRNQKRLSKDVRIFNRGNWQAQHWKTIQSCYNRSAWFNQYSDELALLFEKEYKFLLDWNLACFEWTQKQIDLKSRISLTGFFRQHYDPLEFSDRRNEILPRNYAMMDFIKYHQVFEDRLGFIPNLSILDLLFCEGNHATLILRSSFQKSSI
jgi:WbqC-like protein family